MDLLFWAGIGLLALIFLLIVPAMIALFLVLFGLTLKLAIGIVVLLIPFIIMIYVLARIFK